MKELWTRNAMEALYILLGSPTDDTELAVLVGVGTMVFLILFTVITKLVSLPVVGMAWTCLTLVLLTAASVGAAAATLIYLAPIGAVREIGLVPWMPFAAALLAVAVVVVPGMRLIHRSRYGESMIAIFLAMAALAGSLTLTHSVYGAAKSGDRDFALTLNRTAMVNQFINQ